MLTFLIILILVLLGWLSYQDYKYRAVHWWLFPVLFLLFVVFQLLKDSVHLFSVFLINLLFVVQILLMLTLYFSFKYKAFVWLPDRLLGWGDILFLLLVTVVFSPVNFIVFFIGSMIFVLLVTRLLPALSENIPLAGIQASLLILLIILQHPLDLIDLSSDHWLLSKL